MPFLWKPAVEAAVNRGPNRPGSPDRIDSGAYLNAGKPLSLCVLPAPVLRREEDG